MNQADFLASVRQARQAVGNLAPAMSLIAKDFFSSEKSLFQADGPGQYEDLSARYKKQKLNRWGFIYPVNRASGALMRSVTNPGDSNAIAQVTESSFLVGTRLPYGAAVQKKRPYLFIGPESRYSTGATQGRLQRWDAILKSYVLSKLQRLDQAA